MKVTLATGYSTLLLMLGVVQCICNPEELDQRTKCVALCKEVLAYAKCREATAVLGKVMDGGGDKRFRLITPSQENKFIEREGGRDKFFEKNFPHVVDILEHFDRIKFSEVRNDGGVLITVGEGADVEEEDGELLLMEVVLPKESGVDLQKQGIEGYKI